MNKKNLYLFSLEIKKLINSKEIVDAEKMLLQAKLSQEEIEFIEKCLCTNGYDPKSDKFLLCESDNSAFLKLVSAVMNKVSKKE